MKSTTFTILTATMLSLVLTSSPAWAKDKDDRRDRRQDRRDRIEDRRDDRRDRVEDWRDDRREDRRRDYSYRSRYPRRVIVYQNRSYGYNYYDLQTVLRRQGYYRGPIDGIWGPGSRAALVRYQTHRGWRGDGQVDGRLILNFNLGY